MGSDPFGAREETPIATPACATSFANRGGKVVRWTRGVIRQFTVAPRVGRDSEPGFI